MFSEKLVATLKRSKRQAARVDMVKEQVRKMLADSDQKLILMVRG